MKYIHLQSVNSTNNYLKNNINIFKNHTVCYADIQTTGRGRTTHNWESEQNKNIMVSYLYKNIKEINVSMITYSIAVAVRKYLLNYIDNIYIKWPNDIYINNKKICGILCENVITNTNNVIIGIGININQTEFGDSSKYGNPCSLKQITNFEYNIDKEIRLLTKYVNKEVKRFIHRKNKKYLINYLNDNLYGKEKEVSFTYNNDTLIGRLKEIDQSNEYFGSINIESNNQIYHIISDEIKFIK